MLKLVQSFVEKRFSDLTIKYSATLFANFKAESYIDFRMQCVILTQRI